MPMNRKLYPKNWDAIAQQVKEQAGWVCQWCGRPCRRPGVSVEAFEEWLDDEHRKWLSDAYKEVTDDESGEWGSVFKSQMFTLTVAHLNHRPEDCRPENLAALCAPCHCRYDAKAIATKRKLKRERDGQLSLLEVLPHESA